MTIPNEYIVMFRGNLTLEQHLRNIGKDFSYSERFKQFDYGYKMHLDDTSLRDRIRGDPGVLLMESNEKTYLIDANDSSEVSFSYTEHDDGLARRYTQNTETGVPYGLQMLAAPGKLPTPVRDHGNYDWVQRAGQGVNVYVLDSGIRVTHNAFQGRARNFGGLKSTDKSPYCDSRMDDRRGHGTQ